jgi:hypothetical protein
MHRSAIAWMLAACVSLPAQAAYAKSKPRQAPPPAEEEALYAEQAQALSEVQASVERVSREMKEIRQGIKEYEARHEGTGLRAGEAQPAAGRPAKKRKQGPAPAPRTARPVPGSLISYEAPPPAAATAAP